MNFMRRSSVLLLLLLSQLATFTLASEGFVDDSDFTEFEDDEPATKPADSQHVTQPPRKAHVAVDEDEDESFATVADDEEFEGFEKRQSEESDEKKPLDIKPLTFADIPSHFRSNWSSYQVEAVALAIIVIYLIMYLIGKTRNHSIAVSWFEKNRPLLEQQFALVGDDGIAQEAVGGQLVKDTDASYSVWSSGRAGCSGMLTQLKLLKRQDLMSAVLQMVKPKSDRIVHKIELDAGEMDTYVMAFGVRKSVAKSFKELNDLSTYAAERKGTEKYGLSPNYAVYAEIAETVPSILDSTVMQFLKKYEKYIDYFHISDQYSGARPQEDAAARLPETTPTIIISYFLDENADEEVHSALMTFTFFLVERIRRYRLSREGKAKADKKRQAVEEAFLKTTHLQRQEAAQARREEKTRERKQRLMEEEDPDKQRRLEKLEMKRDAKLKQPKMKQLKIK